MVFKQAAINTPPGPGTSTYLVIDHRQPNGITTLGPAAGNIRCEGAQNKIRWAIGDTTSTYVIPFGNETGAALPLTLNKPAIGGGTGSFVFSTYSYYPYQASSGVGGAMAATDAWRNNQYMAAAGITHMNDFSNGSSDNSDMAVDRFWLIDPQETNAGLWTNYTTPPAVNLTFFCPVQDITSNNDAALLAGQPLSAQRFNTSTNKWGDFIPAGTSNFVAGNGYTVTASVSGVNFFKAWTLANRSQPLPIQLVNWGGTCKGGLVELSWSTASEQDNAFFTVERSDDAVAWTELTRINGAGNSSGLLTYSYTDIANKGFAYYRLSQTDIDGTREIFDVIAAGCEADGGIEIVNAWDDGRDLNVVVSSSFDGVYDLTLLDAQGKVMTVRPTQVINTGATTLKVDKGTIATGIYVVQLQNAANLMARRVMLQ